MRYKQQGITFYVHTTHTNIVVGWKNTQTLKPQTTFRETPISESYRIQIAVMLLEIILHQSEIRLLHILSVDKNKNETMYSNSDGTTEFLTKISFFEQFW